MILLNGQVYQAGRFPDGTQCLQVEEALLESGWVECVWKYEREEELVTLMFLKKHFQEKGVEVALTMPYIPNARMDRVKRDCEVFTLKYFAQFINSLDFITVRVLDPHSNVAAALLDRLVVESPMPYMEQAIMDARQQVDHIVLYYPDEGAAKRYGDMFPIPYCYGRKNRNWEDGKILGLDIVNQGISLAGKNILMMDDIIAYGGSLYYSAKALKEQGVASIYAYATHVEHSILDPEKGLLLKSGLVEKIYTTDSLFRGEHEKIQVITCE